MQKEKWLRILVLRIQELVQIHKDPLIFVIYALVK